MGQYASEKQLLRLLRAELRDGRKRKWGESGKLAKRIGISEPLMSQMIKGSRGPNGKVLRYLGYGVKPYFKKERADDSPQQTQRHRLRARDRQRSAGARA